MEKGSVSSSTSAPPSPSYKFQICFCGESLEDRSVQCYLIQVPDPEACPPPSYFSVCMGREKEEFLFSPKKLLSLLKAADFSPPNSLALVGTYLYSVGGPVAVRSGQTYPDLEEVFQPMRSFCKNTIGSRDVWVLDLARPWDGWKVGPPMRFHRWDPHTLVADGKLYVLGGLDGFKPKGDDGWMEVFDPDLGQWTSLPNPPSEIDSNHMISALAKNAIFVSKPESNDGNESPEEEDDDDVAGGGYESPTEDDDEEECEDGEFFTYNISHRSWSDLKHSALKVTPNAGRIAVTGGEALYWCSFVDDRQYECVIHAYFLEKNIWFDHTLSVVRIFGEGEYPSVTDTPPGFLHLQDQEFCLFLQSFVPNPASHYIYCVILEISSKDNGLSISIMSIQKYSLDEDVEFLTCMLLDQTMTRK